MAGTFEGPQPESMDVSSWKRGISRRRSTELSQPRTRLFQNWTLHVGETQAAASLTYWRLKCLGVPCEPAVGTARHCPQPSLRGAGCRHHGAQHRRQCNNVQHYPGRLSAPSAISTPGTPGHIMGI